MGKNLLLLGLLSVMIIVLIGCPTENESESKVPNTVANFVAPKVSDMKNSVFLVSDSSYNGYITKSYMTFGEEETSGGLKGISYNYGYGNYEYESTDDVYYRDGVIVEKYKLSSELHKLMSITYNNEKFYRYDNDVKLKRTSGSGYDGSFQADNTSDSPYGIYLGTTTLTIHKDGSYSYILVMKLDNTLIDQQTFYGTYTNVNGIVTATVTKGELGFGENVTDITDNVKEMTLMYLYTGDDIYDISEITKIDSLPLYEDAKP